MPLRSGGHSFRRQARLDVAHDQPRSGVRSATCTTRPPCGDAGAIARSRPHRLRLRQFRIPLESPAFRLGKSFPEACPRDLPEPQDARSAQRVAVASRSTVPSTSARHPHLAARCRSLTASSGSRLRKLPGPDRSPRSAAISSPIAFASPRSTSTSTRCPWPGRAFGIAARRPPWSLSSRAPGKIPDQPVRCLRRRRPVRSSERRRRRTSAT
jgi:hypothetical protein